MKTTDIKAIAAQHGIKVGRMKKTDIIRSIQATEGNEACFNSGKSDICGQIHCLWREDCR